MAFGNQPETLTTLGETGGGAGAEAASGFASALGPAMMLAQLGLGIAGANQRNDALARAMQSQADAAEAQMGQNVQQARLERLKRTRMAREIEGAVRVATGARGTGEFGAETLARQNIFDTELDLSIIDANLAAANDSVRSGFMANVDSLSSQSVNPLLAGFMGALDGLGTGLSLGADLEELTK